MKKRKIVVTESELINSIDKIVKEQAAMLGFGNMGGLSLGVSKPSDKYQEMYEDDAHDTYNVNYMDQEAANQNMEDWEMGEDYSIERGSHGHPHEMEEGKKAKPDYLDFDKDGNKKESMKKALKDKEMDEQCGKGGMYEGGCGDYEMYEGGCGDYEMYEGGCGGGSYIEEDSGEFESNYFNSLQGIRTADVYSESRLENLVRNELLEAQAKQAKKWIQGAVKRPGALRKKLGVGKDKKISLSMIDKKMKQIKAKDSNKKVKGVQGLTKADLRTYKQLNLAKSLRGMSKKSHAKEAKRFKK
jgi:hypothetical protein